MDESGSQSFNLGRLLRSGLGQNKGPASTQDGLDQNSFGNFNANQPGDPRLHFQQNNINSGQREKSSGNVDNANQGELPEYFQDPRLRLQQNNMNGSQRENSSVNVDHANPEGLPERFQDPRLRLQQNNMNSGQHENSSGHVDYANHGRLPERFQDPRLRLQQNNINNMNGGQSENGSGNVDYGGLPKQFQDPRLRFFQQRNMTGSPGGLVQSSFGNYNYPNKGGFPEQFQDPRLRLQQNYMTGLSGGLNQNSFGSVGYGNQGGLPEHFQDPRLRLQNNMTNSPYNFQGQIPQQFQNMRNSLGHGIISGFGNNFQGMNPKNTTDDQEANANIDWEEIFNETFFPNRNNSDMCTEAHARGTDDVGEKEGLETNDNESSKSEQESGDSTQQSQRLGNETQSVSERLLDQPKENLNETSNQMKPLPPIKIRHRVPSDQEDDYTENDKSQGSNRNNPKRKSKVPAKEKRGRETKVTVEKEDYETSANRIVGYTGRRSERDSGSERNINFEGLSQRDGNTENNGIEENCSHNGLNAASDINVAYQDFEEMLWLERDKALTCEDVLEESQCTIILLDSSFSMRGEPFEAAKKTIRSFVAGLDGANSLHENVSLISFGEDLCIQQHLTCDYTKLLEALSNVRVYGNASLSRGLALCVPVLERLTRPSLNGVECNPRVLIVSDFRMFLDGNDQHVSQKNLIRAEQMVKNLRDSYKISLDCIPVIKTCQTVASQLARAGNGMVVSPANIPRLYNFYLLKLLAGYVLGELDEIITDETIHSVIYMLQFEKYIEDRDVLMIKRIIQNAAPERLEFPMTPLTGMVPSSAFQPTLFTTSNSDSRSNSSQTKSISCQSQYMEGAHDATSGTQMSRLGPQFSSTGRDNPEWNERYPEDADDSSNSTSEYTDSDSSLLESGIESEDTDYIWLWRDDMGGWHRYSDQMNKKLEITYRHKPRGTCIVSHNGQAERVIFKSMKQRNRALKKEREVQRLEVDPEMMKHLQSSLYGD